jgi:hypothetical protein
MKCRMSMLTALCVGNFLTGLIFSQAFAQTGPSNLNISGGLFEAGGSAIEATNVGFQIQLMDPGGNCVLYTEEHLGQDLSQTKSRDLPKAREQ